MAKKETNAENAKSGKDLSLGEIGDPGPIEQQTDNELAIRMEAFMNQKVEVIVAADGTPGSYTVITPMVNGVNQPIVRGLRQQIKRKYVESLARSRITSYDQQTPDPGKPEQIVMQDITVLTYPFSVVHDPHPDGGEWLQNILDQP